MRHRHRPRRAGLRPALACALAGSLVVAGCGEDRSGELASSNGATTGVSHASGVTIPDDFPLSAGMGEPQDTIATSRTGTGLRDLELCRTTPLRGVGTRDRLVADNSGGESADTRELVVLSGPDEAAALGEEIAALVTDCDETGATGRSDPMETRTEVLASPFGPEPATTLLQTHTVDGEPAAGATVVHVVPVGPALLLTSTYGRWTRDQARHAVHQTVAPLRGTVAALEVFGDVPEPSEGPAGEPAPTEIPADFPLGVGLTADGGDVRVSPPPPDGAGVGEVEMCGRVVWPHARGGAVGETHRLVTGALGPEHSDSRELVVHRDEDRAVAGMAAIEEAAERCSSFQDQVWTVLERDTGHDTVTVGLTHADGPGSTVFQVTRVGSARLLVSTYGEGSLASLDGQADEVTTTSENILPAMCVFTKTGC